MIFYWSFLIYTPINFDGIHILACIRRHQNFALEFSSDYCFNSSGCYCDFVLNLRIKKSKTFFSQTIRIDRKIFRIFEEKYLIEELNKIIWCLFCHAKLFETVRIIISSLQNDAAISKFVTSNELRENSLTVVRCFGLRCGICWVFNAQNYPHGHENGMAIDPDWWNCKIL